MFGFNKKNNDNDNFYSDCDRLQKALYDKHKEYFDWQGSVECKRFNHLQTLIIKTYESINIKADLIGTRLDESFTREDYLEDFKVFFKPEIFSKLREWCKEYEMLRAEEIKLLEEM